MPTPIEQCIEKIKTMRGPINATVAIQVMLSFLPKEKEIIIDVFCTGASNEHEFRKDRRFNSAEDYFNKTFNNGE